MFLKACFGVSSLQDTAWERTHLISVQWLMYSNSDTRCIKNQTKKILLFT